MKLNLPIASKEIDQLLQERVRGAFYGANLVHPSKVKAPAVYKKLLNQEEKARFRDSLLSQLREAWTTTDSNNVEACLKQFIKLANTLTENGAIVFGDLIQKDLFQQLVTEYTHLQESGSKSWIHSYVNLGNNPEFLSNTAFNGAFLHPLLIALIAYNIGGAIRMVDARAKDAQALSVLAQDNMLHIDNTPFNDEYKIILTWEKGKASGPKGQNFVYIPGTHKYVRDCYIKENGEAWSTENSSIFITPEKIEHVFQQQREILSVEKPLVAEVQHRDKPLTTVFSAGSLVHHRYRTEEASPRSCVILAFHRINDNPGEFLASKHSKELADQTPLTRFLFDNCANLTSPDLVNLGFIGAMALAAEDIREKVNEIYSSERSAEIIEQNQIELSDEALIRWKTISTEAPTVEALKQQQNFLSLDEDIKEEALEKLLLTMMMFDKHGSLDLILYSDNHEEIRKWARNRIREMKEAQVAQHAITLSSLINPPNPEYMLDIGQLQNLTNHLVDFLNGIAEDQKHTAHLSHGEKISPIDAHRSMRQLILDLGESISRSHSKQAFLSTSLFLLLVCCELQSLYGFQRQQLNRVREALLNHYFTTAVIIEHQIKNEFLVKSVYAQGTSEGAAYRAGDADSSTGAAIDTELCNRSNQVRNNSTARLLSRSWISTTGPMGTAAAQDVSAADQRPLPRRKGL